MMAHFSMPLDFFSSSTILGMRGNVLGGAAWLEKKAPSFCCLSLSSPGGYQEMSAGEPSKKSGMKTWY